MYCNDCGADLDFQRCRCEDRYARERGFWHPGVDTRGKGSTQGGGREKRVVPSDAVHMPMETTDETAQGARPALSEEVR